MEPPGERRHRGPAVGPPGLLNIPLTLGPLGEAGHGGGGHWHWGAVRLSLHINIFILSLAVLDIQNRVDTEVKFPL